MLMLIWRRSAGTPLAPVIAENCADRKSANATQIAGFPTVVVDAVRACKFFKWQAAAHRLLFRLCRMLPRWVSGTLYSRQRDQRFYTNDAVMCAHRHAFSDVFTGGYVSVTASALALAKTSNSLKMLDDVQQVAVFHVIRKGESCPLEVVDTDT